jgi:predicted metal-dependent peptidase
MKTKTKPTITIDSTLIKLRLSGNPQDVAIANAILAFKIIETRSIPTAATDGIVMLFNPDFIASLPVDQVVGVIVHELMHVRLSHTERFKKTRFSNHLAANMAMDDEINPMVEKAGYDLPSDICYPHQHGSESGKSWESYYAARLAELTEDEPDSPESDENKPDDKPSDEGESSESGSNTGDGDGGQDGKQSQESEDASGSPEDDEQADGDKPSDGGENDDSGSNTGDDGQASDGCHPAGELAKQYAPELLGDEETPEQTAAANSESVEDAIAETDIGDAAIKASKGKSKSGGGTIDRSTDEPVVLEVSENDRWQDVVIETFRRQSPEAKVNWGRRSRRMQPNSIGYIPARQKVNGLAIALVVDVSGSCTQWFPLWQSLANELIEEVANIERLEIVYHHHAHCFTDTWTRGEGEIELECNESGGTCHKEALAEVETLDIDAIIQFTDCETYWPEDHPEQDCVTVLPPRSYQLCPFGVNVQATIQRASL